MADRRELLDDPEEAERRVLDGRQALIWTALPGYVTAVDLATMTVSVQPTIQGMLTLEDGSTTYVNLPVLIHVPIVFPSAGGFTITFPVAVNDEVLVVFSSRCIDSWWQNGGIGIPMEARMHDLSDGFAIFAPKSQPKVITGISCSNLQIRNDANTAHVEITPAGAVNIVTASTVAVTGNLTVSGTIVATGAITGAGVGLSTHHHTGVTTGGGNTGGPVG